MNAIVTSWSDFHKEIDEMPKRLKWKEQRAWLYKQLSKRERQRFSCFEVGENMLAAQRLSVMIRQGIVEITDGGDFPWSHYKLNPKRIYPRPLKPIHYGDNSIMMGGGDV